MSSGVFTGEELPPPIVSVKWLESRRIFDTAKNTISEWEHRAQLVHLFNHFFPEELKKHLGRGTGYSDRIAMGTEFLELVNRHLFCLECMGYEDMLECNEGYLGWVPVHIHNKDWWEWRFKDLDLFEQAIVAGMGLVENGELVDLEDVNILDNAAFNPSVWKRLKRHKAEPLCYLSDALRIVGHCAFNGWIDYTDEDLHSGYVDYPDWSVPTVEGLAEKYKESQALWEGVHKLNKWLKGDESRVAQVAELVRLAINPKRKPKEKSKALVDILR